MGRALDLEVIGALNPGLWPMSLPSPIHASACRPLELLQSMRALEQRSAGAMRSGPRRMQPHEPIDRTGKAKDGLLGGAGFDCACDA